MDQACYDFLAKVRSVSVPLADLLKQKLIDGASLDSVKAELEDAITEAMYQKQML